MSSEIRCDTPGCTERIIAPDDITQYTAAGIARDARWLVLHGIRRDYHHCFAHRSTVAAILRFAAGDGRGDPPGIHIALRELSITNGVADAVWSAYYAVNAGGGTFRDELLEAARRVEMAVAGA